MWPTAARPRNDIYGTPRPDSSRRDPAQPQGRSDHVGTVCAGSLSYFSVCPLVSARFAREHAARNGAGNEFAGIWQGGPAHGVVWHSCRSGKRFCVARHAAPFCGRGEQCGGACPGSAATEPGSGQRFCRQLCAPSGRQCLGQPGAIKKTGTAPADDGWVSA